MLVEFQVGNYLSFNDIRTFSMVGSTPIKEHESDDNFCNVTEDPSGKLKILKSAVLYGANGSGKSNLFSAMNFFRDFILNSSSGRQATDKIKITKFLLSTETEKEPSYFEMVFFIDDTRFRYGFEADEEKVHSEWLFSLSNKPSSKEVRLFTREFQDIEPNVRAFKEGKDLESRTRANALFLSTVAQLNGEISNQILEWFKQKFNLISALNDSNSPFITVEKFQENEKYRNLITDFFKSVNVGFDDIEIIEGNDFLKLNQDKLPKRIPKEVKDLIKAFRNLEAKSKETSNSAVKSFSFSINAIHNKYNKANKIVGSQRLNFGVESKGTNKLLGLLGPIIDTIENGKVLVIDELDSSLHTLLTVELIKFFHSRANKKAQLIFASHDTNLLRKDLFRRDQIWFAEKDEFGATDLYSLVEYKINQANTVRNDASFEKDW
jgi:AAA15 family ATPase/GTPase